MPVDKMRPFGVVDAPPHTPSTGKVPDDKMQWNRFFVNWDLETDCIDKLLAHPFTIGDGNYPKVT